MPRCSYTILATKKKCLKNALDGCTYCAVHKRIIDGKNANEQAETSEQAETIGTTVISETDVDDSDDVVTLTLPPVINQKKNKIKDMGSESESVTTGSTLNNQGDATNTARRFVKVVKRRVVEEQSGDTITEDNEDIKRLEREVAALSKMFGDFVKIVNTVNTENTTNTANTPKKASSTSQVTAKAIMNKARWIHYSDFKRNTDIIAQIRQVALNSKLITASMAVPWQNVKMVADQHFDALDDVNKRLYFDSAKTFLMNKAVAKQTVH